ncbi:MAG: hypothetical protein K2X87_23100 [Gemmataceae bacterium]|nr:hypothetical protein [Gemmataceae bacterium]
MIELTEEQMAAVATNGAGPVEVIDPRTGERFLLLRATEHAKFVLEVGGYDDEDWTEEGRAAAYWQAVRAMGWDENEWSIYDDPKYDTPEG